jgi:hypothetical protein
MNMPFSSSCLSASLQETIEEKMKLLSDWVNKQNTISQTRRATLGTSVNEGFVPECHVFGIELHVWLSKVKTLLAKIDEMGIDIALSISDGRDNSTCHRRKFVLVLSRRRFILARGSTDRGGMSRHISRYRT